MSRRDAHRRSTKPVPQREPPRSEPLVGTEKWLLGLAGGNVLIIPWTLGGMTVWSQVVTLLLSIAAFAIALRRGDMPPRLQPFERLRRFPIFWLGLAYFAFVIVQISNPAWEYRVVQSGGWHLVRTSYLHWLPHGIGGTPFSMMNGWRVLMIHGAAWLMICAVWIGINRRKTARLLLAVIAVNGAFVALGLILQRLLHPDKILGIWKAPADYFVAGFVYKNHAGVYFNIVLAACLGLACWHARHAERQMKKSHPGLLFAFLGLLIVVAQLFTYARAATLTSLGIFLVIGLAVGGSLILRSVRAMPVSVLAVMVLLGVGFVGVCAVSLNPERVWEKFGRLFQEDEASSITARRIATRATLEMAGDSRWVGHGAGGFRFLFPLYQQDYPEIYDQGRGPTGAKLFWEHAHDDYAELLAEYGIAGVLFALAALGCTIAGLWRARTFSHPALLAILIGPLAVLANAAVDFPFQNPAVLLSTLVCVALVTRWAQLEPRSRIVPAPFRE